MLAKEKKDLKEAKKVKNSNISILDLENKSSRGSLLSRITAFSKKKRNSLSMLGNTSDLNMTFYSQNMVGIDTPARECSNICQLFLDSSHIDLYIREQYVQVLTELESYALMVFERNFGEIEMFEYDAGLVKGVQDSIEDVPGIISKKLKESKTRKFSQFGLGEKFTLVKKIFELLDNSDQRQDDVLEEVKFHYFLGREIVSELVTHLAQYDGKEKLEPRERPSRAFVYDFIFRNFKHFRISNNDGMFLLDNFFNNLYKKQDMKIWNDKDGKTIGLKKLYPGETLKIKKIGKNGETVYGEFAEIGLVYGIIFYKNGDVYAGHIEGMVRHGLGWLRKSDGSTKDGHWTHGNWLKGIHRYSSGSEIADFKNNNRRAVWIYKQSDFPPPKLQKARDKLALSVISQVHSGLYEGGFKGEKRDGRGTMYFSDCSIYVGGWKNNIKHGNGRLLTPKGEDYQGEWVKNLRHGWGSMRFQNGDFYRGQWEDGKMKGRGIMERANGIKQDGDWHDNEFVADNNKDQFKRMKSKKSVKKKQSKLGSKKNTVKKKSTKRRKVRNK